jgi:DNA-binding MarR family transcriptional regulator
MDAETVTRLRVVIVRIARRLNASATHEGLTPSQASVLGLISGRGPLGHPELAELEGLNPTMLSRMVSKLDEEGLIRRVPNPADLRSVSVEITPKGRSVNERIKAERAAVVSGCVDKLSPAEQEILMTALPALEALAAELQRPAAPAAPSV